MVKALEIDDTLAEAHTSLARIKSSFDWDFPAAEEEFKRAIDLNPNYATAHHWYGRHLMLMGRLDEAEVEIRRASDLDPLSLIINADLSAPLFFARQYDRAIESLRKTLEMDSNFALAHGRLGIAYVYKGMYEEAIAEYQRMTELSGSSADKPIMLLAHAYAASGRRDQARDILDRLKEQSQRGYVSPYAIAEIHAALGEKDQAFEWLEKAYEVRSSDMRFLKVGMYMDSLRLDPRFADLLRRVGFAE